MNVRKKLKPQLILDDFNGDGYNMFDEVPLHEENESEPKEKNGCLSVFSRFFCFFRR